MFKRIGRQAAVDMTFIVDTTGSSTWAPVREVAERFGFRGAHFEPLSNDIVRVTCPEPERFEGWGEQVFRELQKTGFPIRRVKNYTVVRRQMENRLQDFSRDSLRAPMWDGFDRNRGY